jgi:outer membrane lipoprotein-sorting protein
MQIRNKQSHNVLFYLVLFIFWATFTPILTAKQGEDFSPSKLKQQIAELSQSLRSNLIVKGQFTQQRFVKGLNQPLISEGEFIYWRDKGIYWQTDRPFPQATTYKADKTIVWTAPGVADDKKNNSRRDKQFRKILLSMFSFDIKQLQQRFDTEWNISNQQWQLQLTPKDKMTRRAIESAHLEGQQFLQKITINNRNGEQLIIQFLNMQAENSIPKNSCVSQFGFNIDECLLASSSQQ